MRIERNTMTESLLVGRWFLADAAGKNNVQHTWDDVQFPALLTWGKPYQVLESANGRLAFETDNGRIANVRSNEVTLLPIEWEDKYDKRTLDERYPPK